MRTWRLFCLGACVALSGCVLGYGHCLFLQPVKSTLTGRVHFRDFPAADGVDNVPVMVLDKTAYIYVPTLSHLCLSSGEVQLVGVAEFPENIGEDSHVSVVGSLFQSASARQYTHFLMNVVTITPLLPANAAH
jgi:hypothetical protein